MSKKELPPYRAVLFEYDRIAGRVVKDEVTLLLVEKLMNEEILDEEDAIKLKDDL